MAKYTDKDIQSLIGENKSFGLDWRKKLKFKNKRQQKEVTIKLKGESHEFEIILRENLKRKSNFCVILQVVVEDSNRKFRLKRYDGGHMPHTNCIEGTKIGYGKTHIHTATQRYQDAGKPEDEYAEETTRYSTLQDAFECLIKDCNCHDDPQERRQLDLIPSELF